MAHNMPKKRDETSGRFTETVPDEEIVDYVREQGGVSTSEVADRFDYERPTAYRRLKALREEERVTSREIGNSLLWEAVEDTDATKRRETSTEAAGGDADYSPSDGRERDLEADAAPHPREILEDLDRPGRGADYDRRVDAVVQMYDHLREHAGERLSKSDFEDLLAGRDVGYRGGFDSLWSNWVKANENAGRPENVLAVLPGVEQRGDDYVYQGEGDA